MIGAIFRPSGPPLFLLSFPTPIGLATARLRLGLRRDERHPDEPGIQFFSCFNLKIRVVIPLEITGKVTRSPIDNRRMHINLELNNIN